MKSVSTFKWYILTILFVVFSTLSTKAAYHAHPTDSAKIQQPWKQRLKQQKQTIDKKINKLFIKSNSNEKYINILAWTGVVIGLISVFFALLTFIRLSYILIALMVGILGILISRIALYKIKKSKNPEKHTRSRKIAKLGFILSLVTTICYTIIIGVLLKIFLF